MPNSAFSLVDNPIDKSILETSSMNCWGSSSTLDPYNVGRFIRVKSLKWKSIVVTCCRWQGTSSQLAWAVIAWDWTVEAWENWIRETLISPSVKGGGLTGSWSTLSSPSSGETCSPRGGALALAIYCSSFPATFLRVFMFPIRLIIGLDAKEHH